MHLQQPTVTFPSRNQSSSIYLLEKPVIEQGNCYSGKLGPCLGEGLFGNVMNQLRLLFYKAKELV